MSNETIRDDLSDLEDPNHPHPALVRKREMDAAQDAERAEIHCWDLQRARNKIRREAAYDVITIHGTTEAHNHREALVDRYAPGPLRDEHRTPNTWEISEALRALRMAVEKADRIGGDLKYSDLVSPDNPQGLTAWYLLAASVLTRNAGGAS